MPEPSHHPDKLRTLVTWCPCTARGIGAERQDKMLPGRTPTAAFFSERDYEMLKENLEGFTDSYGNRRTE